MNKIIIDPHCCTETELNALKAYLEANSWDWKEITGESNNKELDNGNRVIEILGHTVEYWFVNDDAYVDKIALSDCNEEHIETLIKDGFVEGELLDSVDDVEECGWWRILK